jgi:hypothetical protein
VSANAIDDGEQLVLIDPIAVPDVARARRRDARLSCVGAGA